MIVLKTLYECDPKKNRKCKKTNCFIHGGPCHGTFEEGYSTGFILKENVKVNIEERKRIRCEYCGCLSDKDYGTCEHCGAPL